MEKLSDCELLVDDMLIPDNFFKGILIGEAGVGKSCILHRIVSNEFKEHYNVTIGAEFSSIVAKIQEKHIKLQVWDTAGQENLRSMIRVFYKGSHAAFLVFDITRRETFSKLQEWIDDIRDNTLPEIRIMLLGNRKDEEETRQVSIEEAMSFSEKNQLVGYYETSAKTGEGIVDAFSSMAKVLFLSFEGTRSATTPLSDTAGSKPHKLTVVTRKKDGCC
eukprot:TRINITY_DN7156_c0_g2_i1.p1 TRINITY_DN7156_c0_g2~~TRINITY_DN7156_c0_g2_i1.p1  ORF type:complete len:253 (-),score=71.74 TRINITY_DN7156_c0_g2_i1:78-734(-)